MDSQYFGAGMGSPAKELLAKGVEAVSVSPAAARAGAPALLQVAAAAPSSPAMHGEHGHSARLTAVVACVLRPRVLGSRPCPSPSCAPAAAAKAQSPKAPSPSRFVIPAAPQPAFAPGQILMRMQHNAPSSK